MPVIAFLICFPMLCAPVMLMIRDNRVRNRLTYVCVAAIMAATSILVGGYLAGGMKIQTFARKTEFVDLLILAGEVVLMLFVTWQCFKYHKYWISLLSIVPTCAIVWLEMAGPGRAASVHLRVDRLSILMSLIIGVIGSLIIVYATGYMKGYHHHRKDVPERCEYFFAVLFLFIGAMFGFIFSETLLWIDFFWEITSVCSYLLISYTQEKEAINNAFRALWMNLLGGTALAFGIIYYVLNTGTDSLSQLVAMGEAGRAAAAIPIALIAFAALTKAAQLPFSSWLLGAMVAPTPSSALLHSATMVKAGIYILLRLAPAMHGTLTGQMVSLVGGVTFFVASIIAIARDDGKAVLASSTISNLGLMVACCGVGVPETIWAAVFLMMFHAVSKSLLFQDVGATENTTGSRNIEDMHGLLYRLPRLAMFMFIGIAGMFLAPFGMLISKWSALKAAVDESNILLVLFIAFGSATTGLYWLKWMGKLISHSHRSGKPEKDLTTRPETLSLWIHAVMMIGVCVLLPWISLSYVDPMLVEMFGTYTDVLSTSVLIMVVITMVFIFIVPAFTFALSRNVHANVKPIYMNGINMGDNRRFIDSMGNGKKLWLSNLYFTDAIQPDRLLRYSQLLVSAVIIVMLVIIVGGGLS